jgi:hypothetical protein
MMMQTADRLAALGPFSRLWGWIDRILIACILMWVLIGFPHYGITWDEPLHLENGERALAWYRSQGADDSVLHFQNLYLYGALYDSLTMAISLAFSLDGYAVRRFIGGLIGMIGLWAVRRQAIALGSPRAGTLALLLLSLTPEWMGQAFANPKDTPMAAAAAWIGVYQIYLLKQVPRPPWRHALAYGFAFGCALGIRVGGIILIGPLLLVSAAWAAFLWRKQGIGRAFDLIRGMAPRLLLAFGLGWIMMLASWPWALQAPLERPLQALIGFSRFPLAFDFPFAGLSLNSADLPWWYVPAAFAVKLPEPTLLALACLIPLAFKAPWRAWAQGTQAGTEKGAFAPILALALSVLLPPLFVIVAGAVLYDGIRHLLFLLPPLSVIAALSLDRMMVRWPGLSQRAICVVLLAWTPLQAVSIARLHPYEAIWHNRLAGGVKGAEGRFELDYWGSPLSQAAKELRARLLQLEGPHALDPAYRVRVCGPHESALYFLPEHWSAPKDGQGKADFYLAFTRSPCPGAPHGQPVIVVERAGATLAYVLDLRKQVDAPPATAP